jgi:Yip1 domain
MDIDGLQKFAVANFSQYFSVTIDTLTKPGLHFASVAVDTSGQQTTVAKSRTGRQLDPQLVGFAVLSMFLGLTLNTFLSKRPDIKDMLIIETVGVLLWFLYAAIVYLLCKIFRGKGKFLETVSVTIQIFATLYVVCSAVTVVMAMFVMLKPVKSFVMGLGTIGELVGENPLVLFFLVHTLLFMIYLPMGLKPVHRFNLLQQIMVGIFAGALILFQGVLMIMATGNLWSVDPETASLRKPAVHTAATAFYAARNQRKTYNYSRQAYL